MNQQKESIAVLDEAAFMRGKLHGKQSNLQKYANLVTGSESLFALFKYELITAVFSGLPGALGLVLRKRFYRKLFGSIGNNVVFGKGINIRCGNNIIIGDNVVIDDYCVLDGRGAAEEKIIIGNNVVLNRGCTVQSKLGGLCIGDYSTIGAGSAIVAQGGVSIGKWVSIAGGCEVSGGLFKHRTTDNPDEAPFYRYTRGPVIIRTTRL